MAKRTLPQGFDALHEALKRQRLDDPDKTTDSSTSTASNSASNSTPSNPEACFFGIPGELRNRIYRMAIVQQDPIHLTPTSHKQPGILRTCRQTREEATSIFIAENTFTHDVISCKPIIPMIDTDYWLWKDYSPKVTKELKLNLVMTGVPSWDKLVLWVEEYYYDERKFPPAAADDDDPWLVVLCKVFKMAKKMKERDVEWCDAWALLEIFKEGIEAATQDTTKTWL